MGRARKDIICNGAITHITFKMAHNEFLLEKDEYKKLLENCIKKYKKKYNIYILERNIMSNHVHMIVYVDIAQDLSNFMRDVNSLFARLYNKRTGRCGNVIMDRFKSPMILTLKHLLRTISYIWLNHIKSREYSLDDIKNKPFCSLYYRSRGLQDPICDSYEIFCSAAGIPNIAGEEEQKFCENLLYNAINRYLHELLSEIYEHLHTIGNQYYIKLRKYKKNLELFFKKYTFICTLDSPLDNYCPSG